MALYGMQKRRTREQANRKMIVPSARQGTLGEQLSGLTLMVSSPEQAERNRQAEEGRRIAAREKREEEEAKARAHIEAQKASASHGPATISGSPPPAQKEAPRSRVCEVIHKPTPEEAEAFRASLARREAIRIAELRRTQALQAKMKLLAWAKKTQPPLNVFVKEIIAALFVYVRDERNAAVYAHEGVEIRVFGAAMDPGARSGGQYDKRLTPEQMRARARREQSTHSHKEQTPTELPQSTAQSAVLSPEEQAVQKAENIRIAAALKEAKERRKAEFRAAHPKVKKAPPANRTGKKEKKAKDTDKQ